MPCDAAGAYPLELLKIAYAGDSIDLRVPAGCVRELSSSAPVSPSRAEEIIPVDGVRRCLRRDTLVIVNDGTRPTPTRTIFDLLRPACDVLVATGAHAAPTEAELALLFGSHLQRLRPGIHDARRSPCRDLGVTSRGTPVRLNASLFDHERILVIGSVEPHYFAGYTGGRKALLPGVAAYDTIEANHALYFEPGVEILRLAGNPVHEDMVEAVDMLDVEVHCLNTVVVADGALVAAFFGDIRRTLLQAADVARGCFSAAIEERADLVIACAPFPMDADLYQSHKALVNAARACKPGGVIVLVSACRNGIGPRAFYDLTLAQGSVEKAAAYAKAHYELGYHKVASFAEILARHAVKAITGLPAEILRPLEMESWEPKDLERAVTAVHEGAGTILYMPKASVTVPVLMEEAP